MLDQSGKGLSPSIKNELQEIVRELTTPGKGILAADETMKTIGKKFCQIGLENTVENRRLYRQMLFTTNNIASYISGVILHEETLYQKDDNGKKFLEILRSNSIIPGIKVDKGVSLMVGTNGETATQGLDDLKYRCEEYYKIGCRFAKWRAVLRIGDQEPSPLAIIENARSLARYASICQESRIVPIVEPDVLQDGKHTIEQCQEVCQKVLAAVIKALHDYNVYLEGILLKPNMITAGYECNKKANAMEIGLATVTTLLRTVPPAIPGIMFLSGGQSEEEASINLDSINQIAQKYKAPWILSFSFGRALQHSAITTWAGRKDKVFDAQLELSKRIQINSLASRGEYLRGSNIQQTSPANKSLFETKHIY